MAGETQIVVQWLDPPDASTPSVDVDAIEGLLEGAGENLYLVDGHDMGGGTTNVFLYAEDDVVDDAAALIIALFEDEKLPQGMRLAKAVYKNAERSEWHFEPLYPKGLSHFDIMYLPDGPTPR